MSKKAPVRPPPASIPAVLTARTMQIDVAPPAEAGQALTLRERAGTILVVDRDSHGDALRFITGAKQLKRTIEDHWSKITRNVDELKRNLLDLKRKDLEPVEAAIAIVEPRVIEYQNAEERRRRQEQDELRRKAEQEAADKRARELEEQERRALEAERHSEALSQRELVFVELIVKGVVASQAAHRAGYKDTTRGIAMLETPKIQKAIEGLRAAQAIRAQAEATKAAPLDVITPKAEKRTATVSGTSTRSYYSCEIVDESAFRAAFVAGLIPSESMIPNQPELNRAAGRLVDTFEAVYPGCRLVKRQGIAG